MSKGLGILVRGRTVALLCIGVLVASACAGSVGKYRNATVFSSGAQQAAAVQPGADVTGGLVAPGDTGAVAGGAPASPGAPVNGGASVGAYGGGGAATGSSSSAPKVTAPKGGGTRVGITKDSITIGLFYAQTGAYTGLTRNFPAAANAAIAEAGKVNGRSIVLKTYDDGTYNASTIQTNERRAKDESFLYFSVVSESNVVLAPLANQHHVPAILGNMDKRTALPLTYAFAIPPYWATQATMLPTFIANDLKAANKRIGVVYESSSAARDAKDAFKARARQMGMNVVYEEPIDVNQSTCANQVSNLQAHQVQLVFMMNGPLGAVCMLRDARALGYAPTWTGVGLSWEFNVVAAASGGTANGIRTLNSCTTLDTPAGKHFTAMMRKYAPNSGADTDDITMLAYGLARAAIEALRRAGPDVSRESFVATMETKMKGYTAGYYPPVNYASGNRLGGNAVSFSTCCTNGQWTTPDPRWRTGL
jgi:branched-chain amino acid transport system substrate-binding protein